MFVVPTPFAPVVQAACTDDIAVKQRKLLVKHLTEAGHRVRPGRLRQVVASRRGIDRDRTHSARLGHRPGTLRGRARLRSRLAMAPGKAYAAQPYVTSRVLFQLSAEGRIVRGRPLGTWLSGQHQWSPVENWLPEGPADKPPADEARISLARAWLGAFGPGTPADLQWWSGWTLGQTRKALAAVSAVEVDLDGVVGYVLPGDEAPRSR